MTLSRWVRECASLTLLMLLVFSPVLSLVGRAQGAPASPMPQQLPDLVAGLKATPGCLGVETARTASGKQVIFAWFENKRALLNFFNGDTHQMLMRTLAPGASSGRAPLEAIADSSGPILTIASLTYGSSPQVAGVQMPVSQIAIELYAPLPGGIAVGGRFAPHSLTVPNLLEAPAAPPSSNIR